MIYIYWVYEFGELTIMMFLNIFVFMQTQSLMSLVGYNLVYFTGIFLGFVVWGYMVAQLQISLRLNYLKAFIVYVLSFASLIVFPHTYDFLLLFAGLNGLGLGMFWIGVHSYEMTYTNKEDRDFYSSMVTAGGQILRIAAPLFATATFFVSEKVLGIETFQLLFWLIPLTYLFSVPFLFSLPDLTPPKIKKGEILALIKDKKQRASQAYYLTQSMDWGAWAVVIPVMAIGSLGTVINVGILDTIMGLGALIVVLLLAKKRHAKNRVKIIWFCVPVFALAYSFLLFWEQGPIFYIIFSLLATLVDPIWRVSEHTIDLHSVELASKKSHFFPALLYRDLILGFGRILSVLFVGLLIHILQNDSLAIQIIISFMFITIIGLPVTSKWVNQQD